MENKKGQTALDIAKAYADPRIVTIVQRRWDELPPPADKKRKFTLLELNNELTSCRYKNCHFCGGGYAIVICNMAMLTS